MPNKEENELTKAQKVVRKKIIEFMSAAFALVAALAWNEAIKALIDAFIPEANGVLAKLIYAVCITVLVALVLYFFERSTSEVEKK
ncbi:hypothetical protein CO174_03175 [Candidatus Uhrbacteria bacterium CG_4_9_14_3_um_filter_50_9]|uniref:DUF5671 domain-containing protein n=1 Tax=Candidatus Uhrbacteria bacterium CG_4_9_14_3_um_filter_50_9 TaxID=1975035 RepID=A0A2M7XC21_9BACT|nr:MAG: hypothetical protein CO174_03175 [Candidatus Uhrbacteria bacterium CG_4_9_14_3_um_filter_50_9]